MLGQQFERCGGPFDRRRKGRGKPSGINTYPECEVLVGLLSVPVYMFIRDQIAEDGLPATIS